MAEPEDRRKSPRVRVNWPVNIVVDDEIISGETADVSSEGVNINCDDPLPMDRTLEIRIAPPGAEVVHLTGRVVWADLSGIDGENNAVGIGICFMEISDADRSFFQEVVEAFLDESN
ncbi:MAG: PilZ domain-containing protein [Desulfobacteraceae bacterium]|nr:PilZ domain-containing protein [Desulfobacteraceae bacterium]